MVEKAIVSWPGVDGVRFAARSSLVSSIEMPNVSILVSANCVRKLDAYWSLPTLPHLRNDTVTCQRVRDRYRIEEVSTDG